MRTSTPFFVLGLLGVASPAMAGADFAVTLTGPTGAFVYDSATYTVQVRNVGNRNASSGSVTIQLPATNTSPQVYTMGVVGNLPSGCTVSGQDVVCATGAIRRGRSKTLSFDLMLPENTYPLSISATASTAGDNNGSNDTDVLTPTLLNDAVSFTGDAAVTNSHCTGNYLTSYYECTLFPSSITAHASIFHDNQSISFPGQDPGYGGTWSQPSATELEFTYTYAGSPVASFEGRGVSADCWEGQVVFANSTYVSMYRVCLD